MTPRLTIRVLGFVGFILLVSLLAAPLASAAGPPIYQEYPIGGEEGINEPPGGGPGGGDGGDPDEFFLTEPPVEGVSITILAPDPEDRMWAHAPGTGWQWNWNLIRSFWFGTPWRF
jgi:hypothetical protein